MSDHNHPSTNAVSNKNATSKNLSNRFKQQQQQQQPSKTSDVTISSFVTTTKKQEKQQEQKMKKKKKQQEQIPNRPIASSIVTVLQELENKNPFTNHKNKKCNNPPLDDFFSQRQQHNKQQTQPPSVDSNNNSNNNNSKKNVDKKHTDKKSNQQKFDRKESLHDKSQDDSFAASLSNDGVVGEGEKNNNNSMWSCSSSTYQSNLSIGARAAITEHLRHVAQFGLNDSFSPVPAVTTTTTTTTTTTEKEEGETTTTTTIIQPPNEKDHYKNEEITTSMGNILDIAWYKILDGQIMSSTEHHNSSSNSSNNNNNNTTTTKKKDESNLLHQYDSLNLQDISHISFTPSLPQILDQDEEDDRYYYENTKRSKDTDSINQKEPYHSQTQSLQQGYEKKRLQEPSGRKFGETTPEHSIVVDNNNNINNNNTTTNQNKNSDTPDYFNSSQVLLLRTPEKVQNRFVPRVTVGRGSRGGDVELEPTNPQPFNESDVHHHESESSSSTTSYYMGGGGGGIGNMEPHLLHLINSAGLPPPEAFFGTFSNEGKKNEDHNGNNSTVSDRIRNSPPPSGEDVMGVLSPVSSAVDHSFTLWKNLDLSRISADGSDVTDALRCSPDPSYSLHNHHHDDQESCTSPPRRSTAHGNHKNDIDVLPEHLYLHETPFFQGDLMSPIRVKSHNNNNNTNQNKNYQDQQGYLQHEHRKEPASAYSKRTEATMNLVESSPPSLLSPPRQYRSTDMFTSKNSSASSSSSSSSMTSSPLSPPMKRTGVSDDVFTSPERFKSNPIGPFEQLTQFNPDYATSAAQLAQVATRSDFDSTGAGVLLISPISKQAADRASMYLQQQQQQNHHHLLLQPSLTPPSLLKAPPSLKYESDQNKKHDAPFFGGPHAGLSSSPPPSKHKVVRTKAQPFLFDVGYQTDDNNDDNTGTFQSGDYNPYDNSTTMDELDEAVNRDGNERDKHPSPSSTLLDISPTQPFQEGTSSSSSHNVDHSTTNNILFQSDLTDGNIVDVSPISEQDNLLNSSNEQHEIINEPHWTSSSSNTTKNESMLLRQQQQKEIIQSSSSNSHIVEERLPNPPPEQRTMPHPTVQQHNEHVQLSSSYSHTVEEKVPDHLMVNPHPNVHVPMTNKKVSKSTLPSHSYYRSHDTYQPFPPVILEYEIATATTTTRTTASGERVVVDDDVSTLHIHNTSRSTSMWSTSTPPNRHTSHPPFHRKKKNSSFNDSSSSYGSSPSFLLPPSDYPTNSTNRLPLEPSKSSSTLLFRPTTGGRNDYNLDQHYYNNRVQINMKTTRRSSSCSAATVASAPVISSTTFSSGGVNIYSSRTTHSAPPLDLSQKLPTGVTTKVANGGSNSNCSGDSHSGFWNHSIGEDGGGSGGGWTNQDHHRLHHHRRYRTVVPPRVFMSDTDPHYLDEHDSFATGVQDMNMDE